MSQPMKVFFPILLIICLVNPAANAQNDVKSKEVKYHWWNQPANFNFPKVNPDLKKLPLISVEKNKFVNSTGDTILFRGVSIADPDKIEGQGQWKKELFEQLNDLGVNVVRLPIHPIAWRERTPEKYLDLLDQAVQWCTELGLYVDIDWHSIGNLKTGMFQDPSYDTSMPETFNFWRTIARHFKGNNTVAFYELFNEPTLYFNQLGRMTWDEWKKINEDMIAIVRAFDKETIPLVAGLDWAYDLTPLRINPIEAEDIAYVTHPYAHKRKPPWEPKWDEDFGFAASTYPIIATEFGFVYNPQNPNSGEIYGSKITSYLEGKGISWMAWVYDPEWQPKMLESWNGYKPSKFGEFIKEILKKKPQMIKMESTN